MEVRPRTIRLGGVCLMFIGAVAILNGLAVFSFDPATRLFGSLQLICGPLAIFFGGRAFRRASRK